MDEVRLIAFYLPQFHPIEENDRWWGKGFTEWTNVSSAKPVFPGHYQPHLPADLGFYDLRLAEVREAQARLAREYGIHGFCYYSYFFNGKRLLNRPLDEVLATGKPDFPFCICWANENWTRKWDGRDSDILIEQVHTAENDLGFIYHMIPFLKDKRYIRVNNKLLLLVYRTELLPEPKNTALIWRDIVKREIGEELYLCTVNFFVKGVDPTLIGFDGTIQFPLAFNPQSYIDNALFATMNNIDYQAIKNNQFLNYPSVVNYMVNIKKPGFNFFRGVFPSWDNTPRRQDSSSIFLNSSPELYKLFLKTVIGLTMSEYIGDEQLVFINAWNEWAEGAHLEPDKKFGLRYLEATREALYENFDCKILMEEVKAKDDESRLVYSSSQELIKKLAVAEERMQQLSQLTDNQNLKYNDQVSKLSQEIKEKDQQLLEFGKLLEQKERYLEEKDSLIRQKDIHIQEKDSLIRQKEIHIKEQEIRFRRTERIMLQQIGQINNLKKRENEMELRVSQSTLQLHESKVLNQHLTDQITFLELEKRVNEVSLLECASSIKSLEQRIEDKEGLLREVNKKLQDVLVTNTVKEQAMSEHASTIKSLEQKIKDREGLLAEVNRKLQNALHLNNVKERAIQDKNRFINDLYRSFSWRITAPVRWLHGFLFRIFYLFFPYGSSRWMVLKAIFHRNPDDKIQVQSFVPAKNQKTEEKRKDMQLSSTDKEAYAIISRSNLFISDWYLATYPDIRMTGVDPIAHFVKHGFKENRKPNPLFDTKWYKEKYPEIANNNINPLVHYIQTGAQTGYDPNPLFGSQWYLERYPSVAKAGFNPLAHYLVHGLKDKLSLFQPDPVAKLSLKKIKKVAVICHVYYPEIWDELSAIILNIPIKYELYVSIPLKNPEENDGIKKRILADFPSAHIQTIKNIGGDINPFVSFLEQIYLDGHAFFCKIHTKKGKTNYGDIWKDVLLYSILGSESIVTNILNAFDADDSLALVGSELMHKSSSALEYGNQQLMKEVFDVLYPNSEFPEDWGFIAGTMFWGRTEVFLPLSRTIRKNFQFEQAQLNVDGQLAHAIERLIGAVVYKEGLKTGLVSNELGVIRSRQLGIYDSNVSLSVENVGQTLLPLREMYIQAIFGVLHVDQEINLEDGKLRPEEASGEFRKVSFQKLFPFKSSTKTENFEKKHTIPGRCKQKRGGINVLLCGHSAGNYMAGGEVSFLDMAKGLKNSGYNLITILPQYNAEYINLLTDLVIKFYIIPYQHWGVAEENNSLVRKIARIISHEGIRVVYVNTIMIREPHKAARIKGIPSITHVRELISGDDVLTDAIRRSKDEIREEVFHRSNFIIANSKTTAEYFNKNQATFIVPNVIDVNTFNIGNKVDPEKLTVVLISSNVPKKGIYEFIEVARICQEQISNVKFLLIGEQNGRILEMMQNRKSNKIPDNLDFVGYCPRAVDAVAKANIVMNLSLFSESFGRTVLEAMAAGRAVVAYDYGAISELIEDGKNGYLVPFMDVATAAEKIIELCKDPQKIVAFGEYGRKIAQQRYSQEVYDLIMGKVMNKILSSWPAVTDDVSDSVTGVSQTKFGTCASLPKSNVTFSVSVVIPNYNYSNYLQERINSIVNQTYQPTEIIFLDDCSVDNSVTVARELLSRASIPYKIIENSINKGVSLQWLKGIAEATGEYIWIAEADDSCHERFLEKLLDRVVLDQSVMGYCQSERIDENGAQLAPNNLHHTDDLSRERWKNDFTETGLREVVDYLFYRNSIPNVSACIFKKSSLMEIPDEFVTYQFVGDWFLYSWLLSKGSISFIAESLNKFRRHANSITRVKGKSDDYLAELIRIKKNIVDKFPIHRSQVDRMITFLNKDYKIDGISCNSDHPLAADFIKEIKETTAPRRRLVFLTTNNGSHNGGSEQLWIHTATEARKRNHDVMVIIKKWDPAPYFFREFIDQGIKLLFKDEMEFSEVVNFRPDLMVISTGDQDEGTEWFEKCRQHDIPYTIINQLTKEPEYWPIRKDKTDAVREGYLCAVQAFFTSHNNHRVMEKRLNCKIPKASVFYQPFFIDREMEIPYPDIEHGLKLALPARLLTIHKGQHLALEVINLSKWRNRNIHLNFYGVGPDENRLKEMVEKFQLKNVIFHAPKWSLPHPDLFDIWRENHAILMPSFMEGMPLVLLNAMICGRVPIVTDIGGHREVIEDNVNGFIATKPTVEDLDEAMERAWARVDSWEEIGKKARATMLEYLPEDPIDHFIGQLLSVSDSHNKSQVV